jgi:hypothetical protein
VLSIVGYSFGDEHINTMITDALQRWPQMRCLVVNPDNLQQKLPASLSQYVAVERFEFLNVSAKQAFEKDMIFNSMNELFKQQGEELPF